ncbi:STAS domain-containing protein [Amycolatopsis nigrescens]|uniref:STAS domain-containing protein n=1 Tax=Amycolatopsis nigrescens TaxID=381445 RepID=UPI00037C8920|nr:anti-sigma factor antagonist [Amycolatopsis nigrescens]
MTDLPVHDSQPTSPPKLPFPRRQTRRTGNELLRTDVRRAADGTVVVALSGELDLTTVPRLRELIRQRLRSASGLLVLDLGDLTFLASAGMSLLLETDLHARARGTELRIELGENEQVRRVLRLTGLADELPLH